MSEVMLMQRSDLNVRTVDQETVIVDRNSGEVHQLNPTASYIWDQFDGNTALVQVIESVINEFKIDPTQASDDVGTVVEQLTTLNLLIEQSG